MPLTPYHMGTALLVALLLYPKLDIPAFIVASVIVDLEPLMVILGLLPWSMHGRFHSLTLTLPMALLVAGLFNIYRNHRPPLKSSRILPHLPSTRNTILSAIAGVWMHVILDAFLYSDISLLYPLNWNPLYESVSGSLILNFSVISIPIALILYMIKSTLIAWKHSKKETPLNPPETTSEEEPFLYDPGPPVPGAPIVEVDEVLPSNEPQELPETPPLFMTPDIETSPVVEPEPMLTSNGDDPDIFLGVDSKPVQWGLLGNSGLDRVAVDLNEPHIVFLCGKQGSGKGYSIGVLSEMLLSKSIPGISQVKKPATIIVFHKPREDTRSEFWSIVEPNLNSDEAAILREEYHINPRRVINSNSFRIFIDPFVYENERSKFRAEYGTEVYPIQIKPQRLTAEDWPYVLSIGKKSGSMYVKKIFQIIKKTQYDEDFGLDKIRDYIEASDLNPNQKSFANMRLETLQDYLEGGDFMSDLEMGGVNIFDLRKIMMEPDDIFSVMMLVISSLINDERAKKEQFVFVINEAHDYLRRGLSREFTDYINYLIRKKRHAGTWLMLDTHFPEDVDPKVIKGSDLKIFHKSDVISSSLLKQVVDGTPLQPHHLETGQAIIRADKSNRGPDTLLIVQVRPRLTHHGGATKTAI